MASDLSRNEERLNKLKGIGSVRHPNFGEFTPYDQEYVWIDQEGVLSFCVTSNNTGGKEWIERLASKNVIVSDDAKNVLLSSQFTPTRNVTYEITVLKGMLFSNDDRTTLNICATADKQWLTEPNAEVACLILDKFTYDEFKAMDLWWIVVMHTPIKDSMGNSYLMSAGQIKEERRLRVYFDYSNLRWSRGYGFAFVKSRRVCGVCRL